MEDGRIVKLGNFENQYQMLENQAEMLRRMEELATKSANGIYNCTTNQKAIQESLGQLLQRMDDLAVQSANGNYNATVNMQLDSIEQQLAEIHEAAVTKG